MANTEHGIERRTTSYGFLLIIPGVDGVETREDVPSFDVELYGMAGIGRYEMFASFCGYEDAGEAIVEAEETYDESLLVYQKTKEALQKINWATSTAAGRYSKS